MLTHIDKYMYNFRSGEVFITLNSNTYTVAELHFFFEMKIALYCWIKDTQCLSQHLNLKLHCLNPKIWVPTLWKKQYKNFYQTFPLKNIIFNTNANCTVFQFNNYMIILFPNLLTTQ